MKSYLILSALFFSIIASAAPRLDVAVGTPEPNILTVVPDSVDPNLYYLFPQRYGVGRNEAGDFRFLYQEHRVDIFWIKGHAQMTFVPLFDEKMMKEKVDAIRKANPHAKFAFVPVFASQIMAQRILNPVIEDSECQIQGMAIGQDIACEVIVASSGKEPFIDRMRGGVLQVFQVTYSFVASLGGQLRDVTHSVAMYAGGIRDSKYFLDLHGKPIKDETEKESGEDLNSPDGYINKERLLHGVLATPRH